VVLISSTLGPYRRHDAAGRCPVCSTRNAACGGPTAHVPIDIPTEQQQEARMAGPLRIYHVSVAGRKVLFRLNPTDAQRLGGAPASGAEPDTSGTPQDAEEKARQPANKAKTPPNKAQPLGNG
jgi:hypothetical protein